MANDTQQSDSKQSATQQSVLKQPVPQRSVTSLVYTHDKPVELFELFNDLIYVYAISQMTDILPHVRGPVSGWYVVVYFLACLVVLQSWLFLTNYVNRFGRSTWPERIVESISMVAVIYLSTTISHDFAAYTMPFAVSMCIMLASISALYLMHSTRREPGALFARHFGILLAIFAALYLCIACINSFIPHVVTAVVLSALIIAGISVPAFIRTGFDPAFVDTGHLVERFEEFIILTFGETVVQMTGLFDVQHFSLAPILVFVNVLLLFATYVSFIHTMIDHHLNGSRAMPFVYLHFVMIIAVNGLTISMSVLCHSLAGGLGLIAVSEVAFYAALVGNNVYARKPEKLTPVDFLLITTAIAVGLVVCAMFSSSLIGILGGILLTRGGVFAVFLHRHHSATAVHHLATVTA